MFRVLIGATLLLGGCRGCGETPAPEAEANAGSVKSPWKFAAADVLAVHVSNADLEVTLERDGEGLFWCHVVGAARIGDFAAEPNNGEEVMQALAQLKVHQSLGAVDENKRVSYGLDGSARLELTLASGTRALEVGKRAPNGRYVRDAESNRVLVVDDVWWRRLVAAERLFPLRKLVERRGLVDVNVRAGDKEVRAELSGEDWKPAALAPVILQALRLRPGAFDRTRTESGLRPIVRLEFTTGTFELFSDDDPKLPYYVRTSRANGIAPTQTRDAAALEAAVNAFFGAE